MLDVLFFYPLQAQMAADMDEPIFKTLPGKHTRTPTLCSLEH
jgi:hypothetical protein